MRREGKRNPKVLRCLMVALAILAGVVSPGGWTTDAVGSGGPRIDSKSPPGLEKMSEQVRRAFEEKRPTEMIPVIVSTVGRPDPKADQAVGIRMLHQFQKLEAYAAQVPAHALPHLAQNPQVRRVSYDQEVRAFNDLNYVAVGADIAERSYALTGKGVTIAVVDSGVDPHPDLDRRLVAEVDFVNANGGSKDPYGHGTHLAGVIAGDGQSSSMGKSLRRYNGIAPEAKLVSVRVLDQDGKGVVSDVLAGIDWVIENMNRYGIRVLNVSLGHPVEESYRDDPLCQAVERAWEAGMVVVASAGNYGAEGYGTINSPGNDPYIITVGASNNYLTASRYDDILTSYSSRGPTHIDHIVKPDLVAPGNRTISLRAEGSTLDAGYPELRVQKGAFLDNTSQADQDSGYFEMSGTSMAAAVVSGMAALMIDADRSLTPDTVKLRLMVSAEKHPEYDMFSEGAGFADVLSALEMEETALVPARSPVAVWTESGIIIEGMAGESGTGGTQGDGAIWGVISVWGADALGGTQEVWGDGAIWGGNFTYGAQGTTSGDGAIWGGNFAGWVWPEGAIWGDNQPAGWR